jgi:CTP:phosphocholine cytidylyltransferase-like protein
VGRIDSLSGAKRPGFFYSYTVAIITRFLPVTKAIPKEMLPILTKPLIQYAVEEAMSAGICNMTMVTNKHKKAIENHFKPQVDIAMQQSGFCSYNLIICNSTLSLSLVHKSSGKITANASTPINGLPV